MRARPRRVLRLITRLNIGGPARQALLLSKELKNDFPTLLAAGSPPPEEGELTDPEVPVHRLPFVRPMNPLMDARALRETRRLISGERPALIHTHMAKAGAVGRFAAPLRDRPRLVHTFHGHVLEGYFRSAAQRTFIQIERTLARRSDVLIAVSPEVRDSLLDLGVGKPHQYRVIPLGFDLAQLLKTDKPSGAVRREIRIQSGTPLIGVLGRLAPVKEHTVVLEAMTHLPGVHLAIFGDGELGSTLRAMSRELGIGERVHFMGWWSDVPSALSDLDVVALTSRNEGTPVSLIEAHASGLPVVATDVGGVRSVVEDDQTGYVVSVGDAVAVADRIRRLLEEPELRSKMGRLGRERVAMRFDKNRLLSDVADLYSELLA